MGSPARHDGGQVGFLSGDLRRPDLRHRRLQRDGGACQSGGLRCGAAAVEALHLPCHSPFWHQVSFYLGFMASSFWQCAGRLCSRTGFMFWVGSMAPRGCVRWSASPLDLLAADQGGTRWDPSKSTHLEDLAVKVADMLEPRSNFSVAILNGRLVVMGGYR